MDFSFTKLLPLVSFNHIGSRNLFRFSLTIRPRLDPGSFATLGVGTGFAIAAALLAESQADGSNPPRRVVCVQGDSSFGFSGMELETACR